MKAMVFAAGLGTRLRPHTNDRPKALVEVGGIPLLGIQLMRLRKFGFKLVVVNVHHFADLVEQYISSLELGEMQVLISDERGLLLDTGGGLLHALPLLAGNEPVYLCNVDVLTDLDPHTLIQTHTGGRALASLGLLKRDTARVLCFDSHMRLSGWRNASTGESKGQPGTSDTEWAFCGLHVVQSELLQETTRRGVFSIIDLYLDQAPGGRILGVDLSGTRWLDVGKPAELAGAAELLPWVL